MPFLAAPKSSTARRAAATEPGPVRSACGPDMSFTTPILTTPSETCACALPAASANTAPASTFLFIFIAIPPLKGSYSDSQILVQQIHSSLQLRRGEGHRNLSVLHHVVPVGERR